MGVTRTYLTDVKQSAECLGFDVCEALIGMHEFPGCDTISAFAGKGKASALKAIMTDEVARSAFCELGQSWQVTDALFEKLECFTCRLYASQKTVSEVNELRYHLFCAKNGDCLLYTSPSPRDLSTSRMPSSA